MNWFSDNVNQIALLGAAVIIVATVFVVGKYIKQMKTDRSTGVLADENWDGIGEYKNPLPVGWSITFLLTIIWALWYWTMGYPVNAYSQIGEWNEEVQTYNKAFGEKWKNIKGDDLKDMGEGVFLVQCAPCHGIDGEGIDGKAAGFNKWGSKAGILDTIKNGSKGLGFQLGDMPAGLVPSEADAEKIADYVMAGMNGEGKELFETNCGSCHGADGKGMGGMSPDLSTYGKTEFVVDVLNRGKIGNIGVMPKFNDGRLSETQKKAVATYILTLSK